MVYNKALYDKIHKLLEKKVSHREVAKQCGVNKNTITALIDRKMATNSIYPSRLKLSAYNHDLKPIAVQIRYYLTIKRRTYEKHKLISLTKQEIYVLIKHEFPNISKRKFDYLHKNESNKQREGYLTLRYSPGYTVQFDWGKMKLNLQGINRHILFAVFTFPYSLHQVCFVSLKEDSQNFSDIFLRFTERVGGTPTELLVDNMRLARKKQTDPSKEKELTRLFHELADYYQFNVRFCANQAPNQKSQVETGVKVVQNIIKRCYEETFDSLETIESIINEKLQTINQKIHPSKANTRNQLFIEEQALLQPLPNKSFTFFHHVERVVHKKTGVVTFKKSKFSVPKSEQSKRVTIRYNQKHLYIISDLDEIIAKYHYPQYDVKTKKQLKLRIWYCIDRIKSKHRGFEYSEEYYSMPKWLKQVYHYTYQCDPISFADFLELATHTPRDVVKKALNYHKTDIQNITPAQLETFIFEFSNKYRSKNL